MFYTQRGVVRVSIVWHEIDGPTTKTPFLFIKKKKKENNPVLNWFYFSFTGLPWVTRVTLIFVMQQFSQPLSFNPTPNTAIPLSPSDYHSLSLSHIYINQRESTKSHRVFVLFLDQKAKTPTASLPGLYFLSRNSQPSLDSLLNHFGSSI